MQHDRPILLEIPDRFAGDRILVRPFLDEDAEGMHAAVQESIEHLRPWMPWCDQHQTVEDSLAYIRRSQAEYLTRDAFHLGIFDRHERFLGGTGVHVHNWRVPAFEIGYWIRRSEEGRGYVTEAARLMTRFAFDSLRGQRVVIRCDARNTRSAAIPRRLGYVEEGRLRHAEVDTSGEVTDMLLFAMIPEDYERARAGW